MKYKIEICTNSVTSCLQAQKGGAYRVELCAGIPEGGTTPSYGEIAVARELLDIKLNIIIRPRGGDFLYSDVEHQTMLHDIRMAKKLGVDGVVIGCLTADGKIDMQRNKELIDAAQGMSVTFHRAFDMCKNPFEALEQIISLGCDSILSSGQQPTAMEGVTLLSELIAKADGRITIMPGSGVNESNIAAIAQKTKATEFHFSAREPIDSKMQYRNPNLKMGGTVLSIDEYVQNITSAEKVKQTIDKLIE
ncbi:MAG TPA: copper homeostasis protein CutC [Dysgonamonadaceae bacterium]|nr:copper homeostasis protein CutC [Dysgonamonadaceae bacterium]